MTRLKELREEKGLTARAAAFDLDIPYTTYVGYEKGTRNPKFDTLINIADYFDISLDYLLGRSGDRGGRMPSDAAVKKGLGELEAFPIIERKPQMPEEKAELVSMLMGFIRTVTNPDVCVCNEYIEIFPKVAAVLADLVN